MSHVLFGETSSFDCGSHVAVSLPPLCSEKQIDGQMHYVRCAAKISVRCPLGFPSTNARCPFHEAPMWAWTRAVRMPEVSLRPKGFPALGFIRTPDVWIIFLANPPSAARKPSAAGGRAHGAQRPAGQCLPGSVWDHFSGQGWVWGGFSSATKASTTA